MMKSLTVSLTVFFSFLAYNSHASEGYYPVSVIELIAVPAKYEDQKIRVKGYFEFGIFPAIYPNHLSAEIDDTASAIDVVDQTEDGSLSQNCSKKYVTLSGRLAMYQNHYEIRDIVEALDAKTLKPCWVKK
jgi:hypothetical protein